jgi:hypothetical protein
MKFVRHTKRALSWTFWKTIALSFPQREMCLFTPPLSPVPYL